MMNFNVARANMINNQIRPVDVTNHRVLEALFEIPREEFVGVGEQAIAYIDEDIPLTMADGKRYLMEPTPFAKLVQLAAVEAESIVLDIGCGSGYSAAVLSKLAETVVAVEEDASLAAYATEKLSQLGCDNCVLIEGKLSLGLQSEGPYDVIFIGGAVEEIPQNIFDQLKDGGRLVAVVGHGNSAYATRFIRDGDVISHQKYYNCAILPLPGFEKTEEFQF